MTDDDAPQSIPVPQRGTPAFWERVMVLLQMREEEIAALTAENEHIDIDARELYLNPTTLTVYVWRKNGVFLSSKRVFGRIIVDKLVADQDGWFEKEETPS